MIVWRRILEAIDRNDGVAMVTVAATKGSAPREAGARMIVNPDGSFTGTIGGGALEWQAIALAQAAQSKPSAPKAEVRRFALGPELGQCCGGQVELVIEVFAAGDREAVAALAAREATGSFATIGRLTPEGVARAVTPDPLPPGSASYQNGLFREGFGDERRRVILCGAGHVGRALVLALAPLPFTVQWVDPRPDAFPAYVPANVETLRAEDPAAVFADAPADSFVLVMSHSHQLDLALVHAALRDERFPYVGLIGSRTKRARFERRLAEAGIPQARIKSLVCPIGVVGIHSKAPAVIAAATAAELLVRDEALRAGKAPETALPVSSAAG
jgi:xanthine dehydrogenase accessory factor